MVWFLVLSFYIGLVSAASSREGTQIFPQRELCSLGYRTLGWFGFGFGRFLFLLFEFCPLVSAAPSREIPPFGAIYSQQSYIVRCMSECYYLNKEVVPLIEIVDMSVFQ